ncbi:hypothetical protein ACFU7U_35655, partial [Streptomyces celluloflavus]
GGGGVTEWRGWSFTTDEFWTSQLVRTVRFVEVGVAGVGEAAVEEGVGFLCGVVCAGGTAGPTEAPRAAVRTGVAVHLLRHRRRYAGGPGRPAASVRLRKVSEPDVVSGTSARRCPGRTARAKAL